MARTMHPMTPGVRREVFRLAAKGWTIREIAAEVSRSFGAVRYTLKPLGGVIRSELVEVPSGRMSLDDRVEIRLGLERGDTLEVIGARVGRHKSTICREIQRNGGRSCYRPITAHRQAQERARRPKSTKLASNERLCARVIADLEELWSPEQIAHRLRADHPDEPEMWVSHETIYKSLYVQGRGELRRELARCLRSGRATRRPRGRRFQHARVPDKVMISERPPEVEDRAVPGHWEGDLIMGKASKSAIGTLVERTTRFVVLLHLPDDHKAPTVRDAMATAIATVPDSLMRSITWDQGAEMADHVRFTTDTGISVYFCNPHAPWQRGSNENTNGLLRQYFPKSTNLSVHGPEALQAAADSLNGRPRKTLAWRTPAEAFAELVASTG